MRSTWRTMQVGWVVGAALGIAMGLGFVQSAFAEESKSEIHTIVGAGNVGGGSQIEKTVIEECIMHIPSLSDLRPVAEARAKFVKAINGDLEDNRSVRTYSASVEVTYVVHQKMLVVVTTSSVERSEPVLQEVSGRFDKSVRFESNSQNGDMFGGRDLVKSYFFSSEEKAVEDVMRRAQAWVEQKGAVLCTP